MGDRGTESTESYAWPCLVEGEEQLWHQVGERFAEVTSDGMSHPVEADSDALRPSRCSASGALLPGSFAYSPFTGAPTTSAVPASPSVPVTAPFGGADGLAELEQLELPRLCEEPEAIRLPPGGPFELAVAGEPNRLLAIDPGHGRLHRWSFSLGGWADPVPIGHSNEADRDWASAVSAGLVALSTARGLTIVDPGAPHGPEVVLVAPGRGWAAPAATGAGFHWPCTRHDRSVLVSVATDGSLAERVTPLPDEAVNARPSLTAPAVDGLDYVYWVSGGGYLCADRDGETHWVDTGPDLDLRPVYRPCRDQTRRLYQVGFNERDGHYCYYRLRPPMVPAEIEELVGWHLSAGSTTFRTNRRYQKPWRDSRIEHRIRSDHFIRPLLAFANDTVAYAAVEGRRHSDRFFAGETRKAELIVSYSPTDNRFLGNFEIGMRRGLRMVPFGNALWVLDQTGSRLLRWAFAAGEGPC